MTDVKFNNVEGLTTMRYLNLKKLKNPSEFLLLGDSKKTGVKDRIPFSIFTSDGTGYGKLYLSHDQKTVTTAWGDGHAESSSVSKIQNLYNPGTRFAFAASDL